MTEGATGLKPLVLPLYVPTFLVAAGMGAVTPLVPLHAMDLGASVAVAGLVVAIKGLGSFMVSIPGGMLCGRFGERRVILWSALVLAGSAVVVSLVSRVALLAPLLLLMGAAHGLWMLSRLAWARRAIAQETRGRALSIVGGVNRIGWFVGPVAGGFLGQSLGLEAVFVGQALITAVALLLSVFSLRDFPSIASAGVRQFHLAAQILRDHRRVLLTAGGGMVFLGLVRSAFKLVIPLWGDRIGLDVAAIGLVVGISSAVDMSLFVPAGLLMDRMGRKWSAVPTVMLMGISVALVPLSSGFLGLLLIAILGGFGNGLGSGINMTFGADLAPAHAPGQFLGIWRAVSDIGQVLGPVVAGAAAAALTLAGAAIAAGALGLAGGFIFMFLVPEPLRRTRR